jgi:hypothetical protein
MGNGEWGMGQRKHEEDISCFAGETSPGEGRILPDEVLVGERVRLLDRQIATSGTAMRQYLRSAEDCDRW